MKNKATLLTVLLFALCLQSGFAQRTISGVVRSAESGETLPGVAILEKGTRNGTATNFEGRFDLTLTTENPVLVFQAIGMETKEVTLGAEDFITVNLAESTEQLEEVVVTALGVTREKRSLGYATSTVESEEITQGGERSPLNSIQGKVPGVNITSASGSPGSSSRIIIRGMQSVSQNNQPLFVIDGVPISNSASTDDNLNGGFDFGNGANAINPEDIENISVLKGASATALYGSRAANGVVLITTKKGTGLPGRRKTFGVDYAGNVTFTSPLRLPEYQSTFGQGWDGTHYLDENGSWGPRFDGRLRPWGRVVDNAQLLKPYEFLDGNLRDFFETGVAYNNSVSISGGDDLYTVYSSFSNVNSDGIYPTDVDKYNRNTISLRGSRNVEKVTISGNLNFSDTRTSFVPTGQGLTVYNNLMQMPNDLPITEHADYQSRFYNIDDYFTPYGVTNPYFALNEYGNEFRGNKFFGGIETNFDVTGWSNFLYRFGFDYESEEVFLYRAITIPSEDSPNFGNIEDLGYVRKQTTDSRQLNHDFIYNMDFDLTPDLQLNALAGLNINERSFAVLNSEINSLDLPEFYDISNSSGSPIVRENEMLRRYVGVYAQTNFNYRDNIFLNITARNDFSSTLPEDNNSFFYYGANLGWVFSDFLEIENEQFNYGKFRIAYGTTGNDAPPYFIEPVFFQRSGQTGETSPYGVYQPFRNFNFPVQGINAFTLGDFIGNLELQPEITKEFEVGLDLSFFTNRLTLEGTFYNRITTDLILGVPVDPTSGYEFQYQNVGEIRNRGFEALASYKIFRNRDGFNWTISANITVNNNELLSLNSQLDKVSLGGTSNIGFFAVPGRPMGVFEVNVPKTTDDGQIVVDANGVPVEATEKELYEDAQYDYLMGVTNQFSYRGISLSVLFDIRQGGYMYSRTADIGYFTGNSIFTTYNDRKPFIVPNSVQEIDNGDGTFSYVENTVAVDQAHMDDYFRAPAYDKNYIISKSFVKLREVVLSYRIPARWLENGPFTGLSVSLIGRNLFVWTPEDNRFIDPEVTTFGNDIEADYGEFSANPTVRSYGFALRASF